VQSTINVGAETSAALKAQVIKLPASFLYNIKYFSSIYWLLTHYNFQTEQMSRIVNELDSINFSIKKASKLVKEIGRQVATDKCIMAMLCLIVIGVIAIIIVKVNLYILCLYMM
jgi:hypothetical protein